MHCRGQSRPLAPMCRLNANPAPSLRIAPAAKDAAARPGECIHAVAVDDSQFKVAVERRDGDVVPQRKVLSLHQSFPGLRPHACWHFGLPVRVSIYRAGTECELELDQGIATRSEQHDCDFIWEAPMKLRSSQNCRVDLFVILVAAVSGHGLA